MLSIPETLLTVCYEHGCCHPIRKEFPFITDCFVAVGVPVF